MRISLLCSDQSHPINLYLKKWIDDNNAKHEIELVRTKEDLSGGDLLFLISCAEVIGESYRAAYRACLVLHASDLPQGRGWSPHIWQIIAGAEEVTLSLLEAEDRVDTGRIWKKLNLKIPKHALWNEINDTLFRAEIELINYAIDNYKIINPMQQERSDNIVYYPRRKPSDSKIDPYLSISSQFNIIRVCDPNRFPAYFEIEGCRYKIKLEKIND